MRPVQTVAGMEERRVKRNEGGAEFKYDFFVYIVRTFVNAIRYSQPAQ
jgi:hypothetical protein